MALDEITIALIIVLLVGSLLMPLYSIYAVNASTLVHKLPGIISTLSYVRLTLLAVMYNYFVTPMYTVGGGEQVFENPAALPTSDRFMVTGYYGNIEKSSENIAVMWVSLENWPYTKRVSDEEGLAALVYAVCFSIADNQKRCIIPDSARMISNNWQLSDIFSGY